MPCHALRCEPISATGREARRPARVGLGVLIHRLGLCRGGREHAVKLDRLATMRRFVARPGNPPALMARGMVERLYPVPVRPRQVLAAASHRSLRHRLAI